jgi:hypothetical protein
MPAAGKADIPKLARAAIVRANLTVMRTPLNACIENFNITKASFDGSGRYGSVSLKSNEFVIRPV